MHSARSTTLNMAYVAASRPAPTRMALKAGWHGHTPQAAPPSKAHRGGFPARAHSTVGSDVDVKMQELEKFLWRDLAHLFDEQGIDRTMYEDQVEFRDPLTRYDSIQGYLINIAMLGKLFRPTFTLHDVRRTGEYEITTRWTMDLTFWWSPLPQLWRPTMEFTGESIMEVNPATWKFIRHIDIWDSIQDQEYLSKEAAHDLLQQMGQFYRTPRNLETPQYMLLRRTQDYEVRRYEPFTVAEYDMQAAVSTSTPGAEDRRGAFRALARYLFGRNGRGERMEMTTPVFSSGSRMQFVMGSRFWGYPESLPQPTDSNVNIRREEGGVYAVVKFGGVAGPNIARVKYGQLHAALMRDELQVREPEGQGSQAGFVLAQYNDPGTRGVFRRNEVLVLLERFNIWEGR